MIACAALLGGCYGGERTAGSTEQLVVFHAGSLSVPFREISAAFERKYPHVEVISEAAGSRESARKISDLGRTCDVFGSADYKVVEELLMPEHADFNIRFAANEVAIAYTDNSRLHETINPDNWYEILLRDDVAFGRSDPNRDPCGYRTLMAFQLAEKHYRKPGLAAQLAAKHGMRFVRPKETDLLALLESGEIDYLFIYRSVIEQHGLKTLRLPDSINLSDPEMADYYSQTMVEVTGKRPGESIKLHGEPICYSVTIPKDARNRRMAEAWVSLLLSPEGREIMERNGQSAIFPAKVDGVENLPKSLQKFLVP
ncbi:MAG: tungstate ABC transporter substrate-binding protein WtpA [Armatimonadetes bacterium]|nr:tungstate ABC transporter substrate-binding protein WtpA [Armatimonadota bacterium]